MSNQAPAEWDTDLSGGGAQQAAGPAAPVEPPRVRLLQNWISLFGFAIVALAVLLLITAGLFELFAPSANPYLDIVTYMVLPGVLMTGMVITPLGAVIKFLRLRMRPVPGRHSWVALPRIDLNDRQTRESVLIFLVASVFLVLPVLAVSSYHAYHYSESTEFCGQVCHTVMEPQATAHAGSPHARVTCADCHIGSGAGWFVKSKLSGVRQVFAVWRNSFSRPIPPAIRHLRPARETCEECHWPAKFFGEQLKQIVHYSEDQSNTRRVVRMLLKTGGADETTGRIEGIHMHMALYGHIEYIATDAGLQEIPWVKYTGEDGRVRIYRSDGLTSTDPPPQGVVRTVDCMDCHNRGAHHFQSPQAAVDMQLEAGNLDASLPFLKREAVRALVKPYPDHASAAEGIRAHLAEFYKTQFPDTWQQQRSAIERAAEVLAGIYQRNFFPAMRVDWRVYPENIGHLNSHGCLRCHDGLHVTDDGTAISTDCNTCHEFLNPLPDHPEALVRGTFQHSMDLTQHQKLRCSQCHSGGPLRGCRDCHVSGQWLDTYGRGAFSPTTSRPGQVRDE